MIKNITLALILSWTIILPVNTQADEPFNHSLTEALLEQHGVPFANIEHAALGETVMLHFIGTHPPNSRGPLALPNGLKLTYADIVMLGGDFFGDTSAPISRCQPSQQKNCFKRQFNTLALPGSPEDRTCSNPYRLVKRIKNYINQLSQNLEQAKAKGIPEWEYYNQHASEIIKGLNRTTCGGSKVSALLPLGQYIKLASVNFDHFMPDAKTAYIAGHRVALDTALLAHKKLEAHRFNEANKLLELAYAQNAFASHFLTDAFASGHLRTPRRAIFQQVHLPAVLKLLLTNLMHKEDNRIGLNVVNASGMSWTAYGDGYLLAEKATAQRDIITQALQISVNAVFQTFVNGAVPEPFEELNLFVDLKSLSSLNQSNPLFKLENGRLLKRKKNRDPSDNQYSYYWSGLLTLLHFYP